MELTTSLILELSAALFMSFMAFIFSYKAPIRSIVSLLVLLIPFQLIDTRFGTLNVAITYFVAFSMIIRRHIYVIPVRHALMLLLGCYLLSFCQVHRAQNIDHLLYLISFLSAFLVMLIVYNYVREAKDYRSFINLLHVLNVLIVLYNMLQMWAGDNNSFSIGDSITFSIVSARTGNDMRLAGPFGATMPGLLAEYLVIANLIILYDLVFSESGKKKFFLLILALSNLGCLVATGNRGGIIGLVLFFIVLIFLLRGTLGTARILKITIFGSLLFLVSSIFIVKFTSYDRLFERLAGTEINEGVPDTRANAWPAALAHFEEKPILGHGPRLRLFMDDETNIPDHTAIDFPHNLYLYILCTTGIVGLLAYAFFFLAIILSTWRNVAGRNEDKFLENWPKLGVLLVCYVLFDQVKIEFLRFTAVDYWHFLFMLFGLVLGLADRKRSVLEDSDYMLPNQYRLVNHQVVMEGDRKS